MTDPAQKLKAEALELQATVKGFLKTLHQTYPHGRFAFASELQSEAGIAPVTESAGIVHVTTFCRMLTTAAAEHLAMAEQDIFKNQAGRRN